MKRILIIGVSLMLLVMLVGCEISYAPRVETGGLQVYTTYELGVNFTDHMLAIASENTGYLDYIDGKTNIKPFVELQEWYEVMFTHKLDYLYPQIFYYIPMNHNFDTTEKWAVYFKNWVAAIETRDYSRIEAYVIGSNLEGYVAELFEETPDELWSLYYLEGLDLVKDMEKLYIKAFTTYYKDVWPELSFELNKRCNYVNELVNSLNLLERWEKYTHLDFKQERFEFSLSKVRHRDFEYTTIQSDKIVLNYNLKIEPFEYAEILSHHIGYYLLTNGYESTFQKYVNDFEPLSIDHNLYKMINDAVRFTVAQYNGYVMGYNTERYTNYMNTIDEFKYLRFNLPPTDTAADRLLYALNFYFDYVGYNTPYQYEDGVHYNSGVYEELVINDTVSLHVLETFPTVVERSGVFSFITNGAESSPEIEADSSRVLVISPYTFELIGNLHLYDYETGEVEQLTDLPFIEQLTVKKVQWYDEQTVYYIKGFAYGTISRGGQLYKLDLDSKVSEVVEVVPLNSFVEIGNVQIEDKKVFVTVVTHDKYYSRFTEEIIELEVED